MILDAEDSLLLVVDIQERLIPAIHDHKRVLDNTLWLIGVAQALEVPILASEQYPQGLGHSDPALLELLPEESIMEKTHFSCAASPQCAARIRELHRRQVVITGMEAHVCVLQTALGLLNQDHEVFIAADAVSSRRPEDAELALVRLRGEGAHVVSREMVAFEWLQEAGTDRFRNISRHFLR